MKAYLQQNIRILLIAIVYCIVIMFLSIGTVIAQEDTVIVGTGWNMVGSLYNGPAIDIIRTEPAGIIVSKFFGYNPGGGYEIKDTLKKGIGYWVKVMEDGIIIFTGPYTNNPPNQPSSPYPLDYATGIDTNITLSWACSDPEDDPLVYDIYFGTDNPPTTKVSSDQSGTSLARSGLSQGTTYYWKVVAKDDHSNSTSGPIWRFTTTAGQMGTPCPGTPTVYYEGKTYNTVLIGTQCWLKENLDVGVRIYGSQNASNNGIIEKYCYNDDPANCNTYGGLYQWNEAMQYTTTPGTRGICPTGWHIPTLAEFQTLSSSVGGDGNALKAIGQGTGGGAGTNTSGFSALLAGFRHYDGYFYDMSDLAYFWSSTGYNSTSAYLMYLFYDNSGITFTTTPFKELGFSVRCLKD